MLGKLIMEFTFGVCTYNSEKFITETLESIKYQIEHYGENINCKLVLSDDNSSDETVKRVRDWLERNIGLFNTTNIIFNETNAGIAKSYATLLENIHTEYFIKIDGDDILSSENIFEKCFCVSKDECRVYFPIIFNDNGKTYIRDNDCLNAFYYGNIKHTHKNDLQLIETYKPFMTPQVVITRSNYTEACLKFIREYTQFEDDTSIWYAFKNNSNMTLNFVKEPLVLYRIHDKSLSNGVESIHQIHFLDDLYKFKKCMLKNEKNLFTKMHLILAVWDTFLMKHRFAADHCLHRKMFLNRKNKIKHKLERNEKYREFLRNIEMKCNVEAQYIKRILNQK